MDLFKKADKLRSLAEEVIKELEINKLFEVLGEVNFVGSYYLDTMFRPDIDLIVISREINKRKAVDLTKRLIDTGHFQTVGFADWHTFPQKGIPKGFYWELIFLKNKTKWKFDIWWLTPKEDYSIQPAREFERLLKKNPHARETILRLKKELFDGIKYRKGITGFDIYDGVLRKGFTTVEELIGLKLKNQGGEISLLSKRRASSKKK